MQISKLALRELLKVALRFSMALGCAAKNIPAEPARTIEALECSPKPVSTQQQRRYLLDTLCCCQLRWCEACSEAVGLRVIMATYVALRPTIFTPPSFVCNYHFSHKECIWIVSSRHKP